MNEKAFFTRRWTKIIAIIAAVIFGISAILPWYSYSISVILLGNLSTHISPIASYVIADSLLDPTASQDLGDQFEWTSNPIPAILIIAIAIAVIVCARISLNSSSRNSRLIANIVGIALGISGTILAITVANFLPTQEISYSNSDESTLALSSSYSAGRSIGFYTALVSAISIAAILIVDLILNLTKFQKSSRTQATSSSSPDSIYPTPTEGRLHDPTADTTESQSTSADKTTLTESQNESTDEVTPPQISMHKN